jgi:CheY-like chemotaxis protein/HPt (histidine-containing phosphotransfer) domain-containing protein
LLASLPATIATLRNLHQNLVKAPDDAARTKQLLELYRLVHGLTGNAGLAGLHVISQFADAFEALLKELQEKPKNVNASTLRTVASAIDFLNILRERAALPDQQEVRAAQILVVDDEAISRRAVAHALEKARLKSISSDHPLTAFQMLNERQFDLVFLDVDMPEMNGYELCSKLRALPKYKQTPVVFVTSLNDFENRANSTMSGGNDFIAKPFLFVELAVKALIYVLRAQFTPAK